MRFFIHSVIRISRLFSAARQRRKGALKKCLREKQDETAAEYCLSADTEEAGPDCGSPDPRCCSRYQFLDFIERTPQKYMPGILTCYNERGYMLSPEFSCAVYRKLKYGSFSNPLDFEKEFGNNFDFIVFDPGNAKTAPTILYIRHSRIVFRYRPFFKNTGKRDGGRTQKEKAYIDALNRHTVITWNTDEHNLNSVLRACCHDPVRPARVVKLYDEIKNPGLSPDGKSLGTEFGAGKFPPADPSLFYARVWMALRERTSDQPAENSRYRSAALCTAPEEIR